MNGPHVVRHSISVDPGADVLLDQDKAMCQLSRIGLPGSQAGGLLMLNTTRVQASMNGFLGF